MSKPSSRRRMVLTLSGIAVVALAAGGVLLATVVPGFGDPTDNGATSDSSAIAQAVPYEPFTWGEPDAPVEILEFSSYTCSHCGNFHADTFPALKERYLDTGKARLTLIDFPLDNVAGAVSLITHCAPRDAGKKLSEIFYTDQSAWMTRTPAESISGIARLGGMTQEDIDACLNNEPLYQAIIDGRSLADERYDIKGTPTFVINGQKHEGGYGIDEMSAAIEAALGEAGE
ncbi:thioredoxin domain-containing protein [uncultured Rhodospira sp.]|uniref:thioredoxin domain-containing protein n=1 Tax=uncultured Rhodospira sp. TaxID=1936189 RepID=UPI00261D5418|nr:thioredoxin domain-containing protein [uncultured Rhodospira sp.]